MLSLSLLKFIVGIYFLIVLGQILLDSVLRWGFVKNSTNSIVKFLKAIVTPVNTVASIIVTPVLTLVALIPPQAELLIVLAVIYFLI